MLVSTVCITCEKAGQSSFCSAAAASGGRTPTSPLRWNAGNDTNKRKTNMALTRDYKETIVARIKRDGKFARALYAEAVGALLEGDTAEGLSHRGCPSHDVRWKGDFKHHRPAQGRFSNEGRFSACWFDFYGASSPPRPTLTTITQIMPVTMASAAHSRNRRPKSIWTP